MNLRSIAVVVALASPLGCAEGAGPARAPSRFADPRPFYRLDYVIAASEAGRAPANSAYTLQVADRNTGELRLGVNVPLAAGGAGPAPRQDVGVLVRSQVDTVGEQVRLHSTVEVSAVDDPPAVRKMVANTDAVIVPGKPVVVARMDDPTSHRRYEVTVTATKVE